MAMKSSGLAPHWKSHPSPSESHGVLRLKQKQLLIDYDNPNLNQVPSTFLHSFLHFCSSSSFIHSAFVLSWRNTRVNHLQAPHPYPSRPNHTHLHTYKHAAHKSNSPSQTHKHRSLQHALCVCAEYTVSSGETNSSAPTCGIVHVYILSASEPNILGGFSPL